MSLYNMVHGMNQATFIILPMLGKHGEEYPRFRDCFLTPDKKQIVVLTRTGGGNRDAYEADNAKLAAMPEYVSDADDSFDSTFARFVFNPPERFKTDFYLIVAGDIANVSKEYREEVKRVYPKLGERVALEEGTPLITGFPRNIDSDALVGHMSLAEAIQSEGIKLD